MVSWWRITFVGFIAAVAVAAWYVWPKATRRETEGVAPPPSLDKKEAPRTAIATEPQLATLPLASVRSWQQIDNPQQDGWTTEVFSERAGAVLNHIGDFLVSQQVELPAPLAEVAAADFASDQLSPDARTTLLEDGVLRSERWADPPPLAEYDLPTAPAAEWLANAPYRGEAGLAHVLGQLRQSWGRQSPAQYKFKLFRVQLSEQQAITRQYVSLSGTTAAGRCEQQATWRIYWTLADVSSSPRIRAIVLEDFQQTIAKGESPLFSDCTQSILGANECYRQQFLIGLDQWLERIQETRYFSPLGTPGLAVGDVDGDGRDDLYVCQEHGLPNRLFLQQADGTAREVAHDWGVDWLEGSRSALLVDLDNDGDQDLVVALLGSVVVAENQDRRGYKIRAVLPTDDDTMSLCAADYDHDADVDIYVCVDYPNDYFSETSEISVIGGESNAVYYDANNAGRNSLFRNDIAADAWKFTDVTKQTGLDENNSRFSLAAAWEDFDNDGDQDLYVANDFGRNNLYRNERMPDGTRRFVDMAEQARAEDPASGMSVDWADIDRDGRMDLYVGNMFSAAGGRITFQQQFKPDATEDVRTALRRFARGSTLLKNVDGQTFDDVSYPAGVTVGRWAWSSNFVDINNDGWQDIVVANGYITSDDTGDL